MDNNYKITGKDLLAVGFKEDKVIGKALAIIEIHYNTMEYSFIIELFKSFIDNVENFKNHPILEDLYAVYMKQKVKHKEIPLEPIKPFDIFGKENIELGAIQQIETAMRLPVSKYGALMPDAHHGYGLPIGGVLATNNAIIPYGVGVDIGCRMALSIYDVSPSFFEKNNNHFKRELLAQSRFGAGASWRIKEQTDHAILDEKKFNINSFVKGLYDKAAGQLGTSGGGNHFVEFGYITIHEKDLVLDVEPGKYLALLTHSGSRGMGAMIANHYTKLAKEICKLPKEAQHLAYFDLNTELGQEYWLAMNLAGDYASACHEVIHHKMAKALGLEVLAKVENHHNFAWKEIINGEELIVHRKGATPAQQNVLGIIPGSMTAPGFVVKGKGNALSLQSASHGAGRMMSRTHAIKTVKRSELKAILKDHQVQLIGGGLDEAPFAYKNIHEVMKAQNELVEVIAQFEPKMVRMAEDGSRED